MLAMLCYGILLLVYEFYHLCAPWLSFGCTLFFEQMNGSPIWPTKSSDCVYFIFIFQTIRKSCASMYHKLVFCLYSVVRYCNHISGTQILHAWQVHDHLVWCIKPNSSCDAKNTLYGLIWFLKLQGGSNINCSCCVFSNMGFHLGFFIWFQLA